MGEAAGSIEDEARVLIDELAAAQQTLAAAQARQAALMLEFDATRDGCDRLRIADQVAAGLDERYESGEFAAMEIGLAIKASKHSVQRTIGIAHRLREETPDAWQAWQAGDIDHPRAAKINHALLRLTRASSKQLLNALVVPVAACKTAELLGRWLNAFIAKYEPDETDERLQRSLADRYVSLRPDLDGVSFLSAAMSSLDAAAIDQVLNALAGLCETGDPRTLQQRRADALVNMLLRRVSNGCHVTWDDTDEHTDTDENIDEDTDTGKRDGDERAGSEDTGDGKTGDGGNRTGDTAGNGTSADLDADSIAEPWEPDADFDLPASAFRADPHTEHPVPDVPSTGNKTRPTGSLSNPERPGRPVLTPCPGS